MMGRPKQYDRDELLDRAVELFRQHGYNGTSTAELVEELEVNRKSMYAEFGSKQDLFEAALEHYNRKHLTRVLGPLEAPDAGLESVLEAFDSYARASQGWASGRGCLLCNTAVERAVPGQVTRDFVAAYLRRIERAFRNALDNARATGELSETADRGALAKFLTTTLIGVAASIRAEATPGQLHATSNVVASLINTHRASTVR